MNQNIPNFQDFINANITSENGFQFGKIPASQTMIDLVFVHDPKTKITIYTAVGNSKLPFQSILAFAGARYSRADGIIPILQQIKNSKQSADTKLGNIVNNYGHASVAEMANVPIDIEGLTKFQSERMFHLSAIYAGQGRSSRYQKWANMKPVSLAKYVIKLSSDIAELDDAFKEIQANAEQNYQDFIIKSEGFFKDHFQLDSNSTKEMNTLLSRSLDTARYFLPLGTMHTTSMALFTNAREWSRIIGVLGSKPDLECERISKMLHSLLAPNSSVCEALDYSPEASELIKYTAAEEITGNNLTQLQTFLENIPGFVSLLNESTGEIKEHPALAQLFPENLSSGAKLILQNILCLYPSLEPVKLANWLSGLDNSLAKEIGKISFQNFSHHRQIGQPLSTNQISFNLTTDFGSMMDLNRHRAWGRFNPIFNYLNFDLKIIEKGYVLPLYLNEIPEAEELKNEFKKRMDEYYCELKKFWDECYKVPNFPTQALIELLPLAHNANILMHASSKEIDYMTKLRVRPGGHINYRDLVYQMQKLVIDSDPFFQPEPLTKPDPNSRDEFLDRS